MYAFPIGAILDSFSMPVRPAVEAAEKIGVKALQVYATRSSIAGRPADKAARRDFVRLIGDHGLTLSALCGDLGQGFVDPEKNPSLIEESRDILDIALEMGTDIVTTHIGKIPDDENCDRYRIMQDACGELARYADRAGAHFAVETGPEKAQCLRTFLDSLSSRGVAVNLDPANLVMCSADDPVEAVRILAPYIVHTHAKDGRMLSSGPEGVKYTELPLGEGDVPFPAYLEALDKYGYRGPLVIERETGADPAGDIAQAVRFLTNLMGG